jgi:hypothetical protein
MSTKAQVLIFISSLLLSMFFFFLFPDNTTAEKEKGVYSVNAGDTFFLDYDTKTPTVGGYVEPLYALFMMSGPMAEKSVAGRIEAPEGRAYSSDDGNLSVQSTKLRIKGIPIDVSSYEKDMTLRVVFPVPNDPGLYNQKVKVNTEVSCNLPLLVKDKNGTRITDADGNFSFLDKQATFQLPFNLHILPPGSIKTGQLRVDRVMGAIFLIIAVVMLVRLGKLAEKEADAASAGDQ